MLLPNFDKYAETNMLLPNFVSKTSMLLSYVRKKRDNHPFCKIYQRVVVPDSHYCPKNITGRENGIMKQYGTLLDVGDAFRVRGRNGRLDGGRSHLDITLCLYYLLRTKTRFLVDYRFRIPVFNPDRHDTKSKCLRDIQQNGMRRALWDTFVPPDIITILVEFCFGKACQTKMQ